MTMIRIAENTWKVGECTIKRTPGCWYVIDPEGGMAGFTTRKKALEVAEHWNEFHAEQQG